MSSDFPRKGRLKQIYQQEGKIMLKKLVCPWCGDIFKEPQRLYCGHTLCNNCLQDELQCAKSRKGDMRCNICKEVVNEQKIGDDMIARSIVEEIRVKCSAKKCTWQGLNKDFQQHYYHQCVSGQRTCEARYEYKQFFVMTERYYSSKAEFTRRLDDEEEIKQDRLNMMHPMVKTSLREKLEKEWEIQMQYKDEEFRKKTKRIRATFG